MADGIVRPFEQGLSSGRFVSEYAQTSTAGSVQGWPR
jgi:hypothetical protein